MFTSVQPLKLSCKSGRLVHCHAVRKAKQLKYAGVGQRLVREPAVINLQPDGSDSWRVAEAADLLKQGGVRMEHGQHMADANHADACRPARVTSPQCIPRSAQAAVMRLFRVYHNLFVADPTCLSHLAPQPTISTPG